MQARWVRIATVWASVLLGGAAARAEGTAGAAAHEKKELNGRVVRADANTVYVESMGAVVPMEIDRETRFSGVRSADELAEGQQVRASFSVRNDTENVADNIIALGASSSGGAGSVGYQPDQDYGG